MFCCLQVEVDFSGVDGKEAKIKSENTNTPMKVLPPWMIKQGMNLTKEQRGEVKRDSKMEGTSVIGGFDDKKSIDEKDDVKNLQASLNKHLFLLLCWSMSCMFCLHSF